MQNETVEEQDIFCFGNRGTMQADFDRVFAEAFGRALDASGTAPMSVLAAMAGAVGAVYREVAKHHAQQSCPCGWQPSPVNDMDFLKYAMQAKACPEPTDTLVNMRVLGQA